MLTPTLDGVPIFGLTIRMHTDDDERAEQRNDYPAVNGQDSLDMGFRGRNTFVRGKLGGADISSLNSAIATIKSYLDGLDHVLADTFGNSWAAVKLKTVRITSERVMRDSAGNYYVDYEAILRHSL